MPDPWLSTSIEVAGYVQAGDHTEYTITTTWQAGDETLTVSTQQRFNAFRLLHTSLSALHATPTFPLAAAWRVTSDASKETRRAELQTYLRTSLAAIQSSRDDATTKRAAGAMLVFLNAARLATDAQSEAELAARAAKTQAAEAQAAEAEAAAAARLSAATAAMAEADASAEAAELAAAERVAAAEQAIAHAERAESIAAKRWSAEQKERLIRSRVESTQQLIALCEQLAANGQPLPKVMVSGSAMGYYGDQGSKRSGY